MCRNPNRNYISIGYIRILDDSRDDSVKISLGYKKDPWFPRSCIEIDSLNFCIIGEESFIREKLKEAQGHEVKRKQPKMIKLSEPDWGFNPEDKAIEYDVQVFRDRCEDFCSETRLFIPKSMVEHIRMLF